MGTTTSSLDQSKKLNLIGLIGIMEDSINENMNMNDDSDSEGEGEGEQSINDSDMIEESEEEIEEIKHISNYQQKEEKSQGKLTYNKEENEKKTCKYCLFSFSR